MQYGLSLLRHAVYFSQGQYHKMISILQILNFCSKFEQLYGGENTTMNMHLHCHLKRTVLDYGPEYAYWLFSFERFNGILGGLCL